jgi:hypothetical protein
MIPRKINAAEWCVAGLTTLVVVTLLVVRAASAGPLWRDECGTAQLIHEATATQVWERFPHEAFPPPYFLAVQKYAQLFGETDFSFRILGLMIGLCTLGIIWFYAWICRSGPPLLLLSLLGLNSTFLCWGTSLRAYGLGSALLLLTFGLTAGTLTRKTKACFGGACLAAIASVQVLLYAWVIVPAIVFAALAISLAQRKTKLAFAMVCLAGLCAVSVFPYVKPYLAGREWSMLQKGPLTAGLILTQLASGLGRPAPLTVAVWLLLLGGLAISVPLLSIPEQARPLRMVRLFALIVIFTATVGYYIFLKELSYGTQPWYYLALITVVAAALDLSFATLSQISAVRFARLAVSTLLLIGLPYADFGAVRQKATNIDLIATKLQKVAGPADLIVVNPWWLGITFNRYYHGPTRWETLPMINDHQIHRFDLVKAMMMLPDPNGNLRTMIVNTLKSSHRVWFVGGVHVPETDEPVLRSPDANDTESFWNSDIYLAVWSAELGRTIAPHVTGVANVPIEPGPGRINPLEDIPLVGVEGWNN